MKLAIILQARTGSSRLPGKVLMKLEGKTVLEHILSRLSAVQEKSQLVVATTRSDRDDEIAALAHSRGILCVRGSEHDVLARYYQAAQEIGADVVVRCNADCPLIDPSVLDQVISRFFQEPGRFDYVSNILTPSFPTGMHCEVFTFDALQHAFSHAVDLLEREHVTPYIYRRPDVFRLHNVSLGHDLSFHRWTLDYQEDFELISRVYRELYISDNLFGMTAILELLQRNPHWSKINSHIQKNSTV